MQHEEVPAGVDKEPNAAVHGPHVCLLPGPVPKGGELTSRVHSYVDRLLLLSIASAARCCRLIPPSYRNRYKSS